ncbi:MAG: tetratricopeptide repeat protein [Gemmatimonadales bacterium]|nr:tetratricopeptide repeat protein [Gemmatimonadales bacterium]
MTTRTKYVVLSMALAAAPVLAQQGGNRRLAEAAQQGKYMPPLCPMKAINSKVDKAIDQIKKSYDAKTPAERAAGLAQAKVGLLAAITQEAQATTGAAWYYLGRIALLQGDPVGADSAFTKAQELIPACEIDITQHRQNNWALLANAAIEFQRKGESDSALAIFRDASTLFRGLPHVYSNMGVVFANIGKDDSAAMYFKKSLDISEQDTSLVEDRNGAAMNLGLMFQRLNRHADAIATFRKYLGWKADDTEAQKALSASFRAAGMADSAAAIDNAMIAAFSKANLDSLDTQDLMAVGVAAFNASRYDQALNAFDKAVKRNPYSREARYNLANTYFALKNNEKLVEESIKMLDLEPMNEDLLRLLAQGQRGLKREEDVIKTAERLVALPFTVDLTGLQLGSNGAKLQAEAVGRTPQDPQGKALKTAPITLVVDFLSQSGTVVDTKEVTVPVLANGAKHAIVLDATGQHITAWRYRIKAG